MKIKNSIENLIKTHQSTLDSLNELRKNIKEEGSLMVQKLVSEEKFSEAESLIKELNKFTKIAFTSNLHEIVDSAQNIYKNEVGLDKEDYIKIESIDKKDDGYKNNNESKEKIEEFIKLVGKTGVSRMQDIDKKISAELYQNMKESEMIEIEKHKWGEYKVETFLLTNKGKNLFEEITGEKAKSPYKFNLDENFGNVAKGYFIHDTTMALKTKGFEIKNISNNAIEVTKNNRSLHLTLLNEFFEEKEMEEIISEKNKLKNIGFICSNNEIMRKMKSSVETWTSKNEAKSKFLTVNLASVEDLYEKKEIFETLSY